MKRMDQMNNSADGKDSRNSPLWIRGASRLGNPAIILVSLLGATAVGVTLAGFDSGQWLLSAILTFMVLAATLSVLWEDEEGGPYALNREALKISNNVVPLILGIALLLFSHLGSPFLAELLFLDKPLLGPGLTGFPEALHILGILLISLPVVTIRPVRSHVEIRMNIGYLVFIISFTVYLASSAIYWMMGRPQDHFADVLNWLLLTSLVSGIVVVVSEVLCNRLVNITSEHSPQEE